MLKSHPTTIRASEIDDIKQYNQSINFTFHRQLVFRQQLDGLESLVLLLLMVLRHRTGADYQFTRTRAKSDS